MSTYLSDEEVFGTPPRGQPAGAGYLSEEEVFGRSARKPAPATRNIGAVLNDTVIAVANAAAGGVAAAADFVAPGNRFSQFIDEEFIKMGESRQSDIVKAGREKFQREVQAAQGLGEEAAAAGRYLLENPLQAAAQAAGSFAGPGLAIKGARSAAGALGLGARGVTRAGTVAGVATGAAMGGGDAGGDAYDMVMATPDEVLLSNDFVRSQVEAGVPLAQIREQAAVSAARKASVLPAIAGGAAGAIGVERLLSGAGGFKGGLISRALKTGVAEAVPEGFEEGLATYESQRAAKEYDPSIDPMRGVGASATLGAALGMGPGVVVGALDNPASRQRTPAPPVAPPAPLAAEQALGQAVDDLTRAVDPFVGVSQARTTDEAIAAAGAAAQVDLTPPDVLSMAEMRARVDREADLLAQADTAGTGFERRMALEQIDTVRPAPTGAGAAAGFVDLTPMEPLQARQRLAVLQDQMGDPLSLEIVPHPAQEGRLAIARRALPVQAGDLDLTLPREDVPPAQAQGRLEAAALAGSEKGRRAEDAPRQAMIDRALSNIEARGGVASPYEAEMLRAANMGRPFDRIDATLAAQPTADERLTAATGIAVGSEAGLGFGARSSTTQAPAAAPFQYADGRGRQRREEAPAQDAPPADLAGTFVQQMRETATPAARAFVRDYDAGRITDAEVMQALEAQRGMAPSAQQRIEGAAQQAPGEAGGLQVAQGLRARGVNPVLADAVTLFGGRPVTERELTPEGAAGRLERMGTLARQPAQPAIPVERGLTPRAEFPGRAEAINTGAKLPRPSRVGGAPAATLSDEQLRAIAGNEALPAITRRGASIELMARRQEQGAQRGERQDAGDADARLAAAAEQGRLSQPSDGRVIVTGARFSTQRLGPGSRFSVRDGERPDGTAIEHDVRVVEPSRLGNTGRLLQQIARIFGKRLVVFESDTLAADGFVQDGDNDTIFINASSQISPLAVFGHELTHLIKRDNPQAYAALQAVVQREIREGGLEQFAQEYGEGANIEELASDLVGNRFQEADFWQSVFDEIAAQNPEGARGIVQRLAAALTRAVNAFLKVARGPGFQADQYVNDLQAVKDAVRTALVDYTQSRREAATAMAREPATQPAAEVSSGAGAQDAALSRARSDWQASPAAEVSKAEVYEERTGLAPYTSEGQIEVPLEGSGTRFSVKRPYGEKEYAKGRANDPLTGLPLNKNGTVTLYFPTSNAVARELSRTKRLTGVGPNANRIYLTNESSGPKVMNEPGNIDHAMDGANVLLQVDPRLLHLDREYPDGRKDFFIPIAEGQAYKSKMTKLFTLDAPRTRALSKDTKLTDLERRIGEAIAEYQAMDGAQRRERLARAKEVLKEEHNVGTLLGVNGKLEKTNTGGYGLNNYNGKDVMSMGLGLASAQKINEKNLSTCPNSAICEGLCLGETSGQNQLYGGEGQFKSGPRLAQYLKTEALVLHPEDFAIVLHSEIERFQRAAAKEDYQPTVRLNVTSDFRPQTFAGIINAFPGVMFYDYTKLPSNSIAPNHHLTYSSTGASQVVNGRVVVNKESNWDKVVADRLSKGMNVAMAFTSRTAMPEYIVDERTGERFQVWDGDNYDARFLDPKPGQPGNEFGKGMIIGLTNKDRTRSRLYTLLSREGPASAAPADWKRLVQKMAKRGEMAGERYVPTVLDWLDSKSEELSRDEVADFADAPAVKHNGFFLDYDPERDGDTLVIRDQKALAEGGRRTIPLRQAATARMSRRRSPLGFYSALEDGVAAIKTNAAPAAGWKDAIKGLVNKGQAKAEEVDWSGVNDWLDMQQGKVTRDQVAEYLRQGGVQVEETVLGGAGSGFKNLSRAEMIAAHERIVGYDPTEDEPDITDADLRERLEGFAREAGEADGITEDGRPMPKYGQYTLPGGENYREVLLTLPPKKSPDLEIRLEPRMRNFGGGREGFNAYIGNKFIGWAETEDEARAYALQNAPDDGANYQSSHWDQKNVLAHIRLNDRTDADGKRVLFVEELQSDWGQEGKKKGFFDPQKPFEVFSVYTGETVAKFATQSEAAKDAVARGNEFDYRNESEKSRKAPPAPFVTKTEGWLNLALKRVMIMAAEGGYDRVAFTTGEQNAKRYSLENQVSSIRTKWSDSQRGERKVDIVTKEPMNVISLIVDKDSVVIGSMTNGINGKTLDEVIGKEMAQKVMETDGEGKWSGLDLKVGGEGMKAFYDTIVPTALKKLLPKVGGGQMREVAVTSTDAAGQGVRQDGAEWVAYDNTADNPEVGRFKTREEAEDFMGYKPLRQPGFDITPAMREKVAEGVPLFSPRRNIFGQRMALANWTAPSDTKLDRFLYTMQDKQIDTKRVVQAIRAGAGAIDDEWDAYERETLYHGRTAKQTKGFLLDDLRPLLQDMQARGVSVADLETYLHNRHAEERNRQIARINPAMPDEGSGIKTADARAYLAGLDPAKRRAYEALARRVDAITAGTRSMLVASGLETQDTIDQWERTYGSYVPLMREDLDFALTSGGMGTGQGYQVRGAASRRATGSTRPVVDILANVVMQRERAVVRAEKARVARAVYGLAVQYPNTSFWLAVDPAGQKDPNKAMADLMAMGINPIDAQNIVEEPTQPFVDPRTGLVTQRVNPLLRNSDNVLAVRIDGQEKYVFFNANDERSQRMAAALKNLDADQLGRVMSLTAQVTRYFASINTQYNPIFGAINFLRDVQGAALNLSTTPIAGDKAKVLGNAMLALRGIYSDLRSQRAGRGPATGTWATLWEEFQREGGQTGFRDMFSRSEERAQALERILDPSRWADTPLGKVFTVNGTLKVPMELARKTAAPVFDWLSDYNETMENAVRLAAYKAAKDRGMSAQQSASLAKNLTVNFNRKGQVATQAGALYAFFNASVQGTTRLAETLKGPAGRKIIAGGLLLGTAQAMLLAAAGFDEDEPPEFVKERNLVIPTGDGKYLTIPMPLGFNVLPNTSRVITEWAMSGWRDPAKRVGQITGAFLEMFNPIGNAGWSVQTIAPTVADPLVALAENRDWTGKPIAKEDRSGTDPTPGYTRAKETASAFGKGLAEFFNLASGGTKYQPGLISPTPDQIDYLIGQATGGVGREALKIEQSITSSITGEELPTYKVPVLGRFYGDARSSAAESSRFYANITRLNQHENEIEGRRKNREDVAGYLAENPEARLVTVGNRVESDVQKMRRRKREMLERDASPESIKLIEAQITARMKSLNDRVRAVRDAETVE